MNRVSAILCMLAVLAAASLSLARAEEVAKSDPADGWSFAFAPYGWIAGLKGTMATLPGLPAVGVDASFSDILDNLDMGFMGAGEARKGRYGLFVDILYMDVSASAGTPGPVFSSASLKAKTLTVLLAGEYRLVEEERGGLDVLVGTRIWVVDTTLTLNPGLLPGTSRTDSETWADPVIGLKGNVALWGDLRLTAFGYVGGFGLVSHYVYDLFGALEYRFRDWISVAAGYRYLSVDYDTDGFVWDVWMSGPLLGVIFRF